MTNPSWASRSPTRSPKGRSSPAPSALVSPTPEQAAKPGSIADGVIVGSAIVILLGKYGKDVPAHISLYVKSMTDALK